MRRPTCASNSRRISSADFFAGAGDARPGCGASAGAASLKLAKAPPKGSAAGGGEGAAADRASGDPVLPCADTEQRRQPSRQQGTPSAIPGTGLGWGRRSWRPASSTAGRAVIRNPGSAYSSGQSWLAGRSGPRRNTASAKSCTVPYTLVAVGACRASRGHLPALSQQLCRPLSKSA